MSKYTLFILFFISMNGFSQKKISTELDSEQKQIKSHINLYKKKIDSLNSRLTEIKDSLTVYPIWEIGGGAISGLDFNSFSNWANRGINNNSSASSINISINGYVHRKGEKSFWKSNARSHLGWQRFKQTEDDVDTQFKKIADMIQLSTLYGFKVSPKLALSALSEWESNLIDQTISPSYIDISTGFTWTPNRYFNSTIHPFNYEFALSDQTLFESSLGAKILFEYSRLFKKWIRVQSNFTGFLSYEEIDFLSNFTWRNSVNLKIIKGIGLGAEYALRVSEQETTAIHITDNHLQSYIVIGLSFELP